MTKTFVQFAHGVLVDVENFAKRHSQPLPSFNPAAEDLPGAADATATPVTEHSTFFADQPRDSATGIPVNQVEHTDAGPGDPGYTAPVDHNVVPAKTAEEDEADAQSQVEAGSNAAVEPAEPATPVENTESAEGTDANKTAE